MRMGERDMGEHDERKGEAEVEHLHDGAVDRDSNQRYAD